VSDRHQNSTAYGFCCSAHMHGSGSEVPVLTKSGTEWLLPCCPAVSLQHSLPQCFCKGECATNVHQSTAVPLAVCMELWSMAVVWYRHTVALHWVWCAGHVAVQMLRHRVEHMCCWLASLVFLCVAAFYATLWLITCDVARGWPCCCNKSCHRCTAND
jgi:hypothetical protein